jgi:hypothetical protein
MGVSVDKFSFPRAVCRWEVESSGDYRIYATGRRAGDKPRCTLLLQVDGAGHAGEGFRFQLEGGNLTADIWTRDILEPPELGGFRLRYETRTEDLELRPNSMCSRWEDVETMLSRGSLIAFRPDAAEDCTAELRQLMLEAKEGTAGLGASIRWCLQAKNDHEVRLILQSLPAPAAQLRSEPILTGDDIAAIHLEAVDLEAEMLAGDPCHGMVPIVFARDPETVRQELGDHPERIHTGMPGNRGGRKKRWEGGEGGEW